jgi:hypothetical protein
MQYDNSTVAVILVSVMFVSTACNASAESEWKTYRLTIDGKQVEIPYTISNGDLSRIELDVDFGNLIISIESFDDGFIQIKLAKEVIDANDNEFIVLVDGEEENYQTLEITQDFRTIEIPIPGGAEEIEIIGSPFDPDIPFEELKVHVGVGQMFDAYYAVYDKELKATWEAKPFVLYSNGTLSLDLKLNYVSENPTVFKVYYYSSSDQAVEVVAENLKPVASVAVVHLGAIWSFQGNVGGYNIGNVIPILADSLDEKSAKASITYNFGNLTEDRAKPREFELQLAWIRIFEDNDDKKYYQLMQGQELYEARPLVKINEQGNVSGSFLVYHPIPEEFTRRFLNFDYLQWIRNTVLMDQDKLVVVTGKDQPEYMKDFASEARNGWIERMELEHENKAMAVIIGETYRDTSLMLKLPREMIDAKSDGSDKDFLVLINGKDQAAYIQINQTDAYRTLRIEIPDGTAYVRIIGTTVVPEFPVNLMAVTAIGLIGTLLGLRLKGRQR